jgi:hypothetical protein
MPLKPPSLAPDDPARTGGRSLFNVAQSYLAIGGRFEELKSGLCFECLQPMTASETGAVLAMVTVFQFAEGLSDHQAADALRTRLDWKYALHLPADYPGLECSELDQFHQQLEASTEGQRVFCDLLGRLEAFGLWRRGSIESTQLIAARVLSSVRSLNRLERIVETMNVALQALAAREPDWLLAIGLPHWYDRYGLQQTTAGLPTAKEQQEDLIRDIEADISYLLEVVGQADSPDLALLSEVRALQQISRSEWVAHPGENAQDNGPMERIGATGSDPTEAASPFMLST